MLYKVAEVCKVHLIFVFRLVGGLFRWRQYETHCFNTVFIHFCNDQQDLFFCGNGFVFLRQMVQPFNDKASNGILIFGMKA